MNLMRGTRIMRRVRDLSGQEQPECPNCRGPMLRDAGDALDSEIEIAFCVSSECPVDRVTRSAILDGPWCVSSWRSDFNEKSEPA